LDGKGEKKGKDDRSKSRSEMIMYEKKGGKRGTMWLGHCRGKESGNRPLGEKEEGWRTTEGIHQAGTKEQLAE